MLVCPCFSPWGEGARALPNGHVVGRLATHAARTGIAKRDRFADADEWERRGVYLLQLGLPTMNPDDVMELFLVGKRKACLKAAASPNFKPARMLRP